MPCHIPRVDTLTRIWRTLMDVAGFSLFDRSAPSLAPPPPPPPAFPFPLPLPCSAGLLSDLFLPAMLPRSMRLRRARPAEDVLAQIDFGMIT